MTTQISTANVTPEQIGKCYKVFGPDNKPFYMVESSEDSQTEYKVSSLIKGGKWYPTCTCESGQHAFYGAKNFCWHVRAAWACAQEEKAALAEMVEANLPETSVVKVTLAAVVDVRELRTKTANRIATWNNSHMSTIPESEKQLYTPVSNVDSATLKRVLNARPSQSQDLTPQSSKGFNLLRA